MSPTGLRTAHDAQTYIPATTQLSHQQQHMSTTSQLSHRPAPHAMNHAVPVELSSPVTTSSNFRPSQYNYNVPAEWHEPVVCQTSTFKNSHFNTAHYLNPDFQPEEWTPESEEAFVSGRKKSS
jgi:ubiquitin thioesterase protein OTUB1